MSYPKEIFRIISNLLKADFKENNIRYSIQIRKYDIYIRGFDTSGNARTFFIRNIAPDREDPFQLDKFSFYEEKELLREYGIYQNNWDGWYTYQTFINSVTASVLRALQGYTRSNY